MISSEQELSSPQVISHFSCSLTGLLENNATTILGSEIIINLLELYSFLDLAWVTLDNINAMVNFVYHYLLHDVFRLIRNMHTSNLSLKVQWWIMERIIITNIKQVKINGYD